MEEFLEPLQAGPVIIEDNCFIGARSEIAEGVLVEEGAVLSMGVYIGASTKIVDRTLEKYIMEKYLHIQLWFLVAYLTNQIQMALHCIVQL